MKRTDITSIGDVLRQTLEEHNLTDRLEELKAADLWPRIVGDYIASMTLKPYVSAGTMTIRVPDAALRQELAMNRTGLIREINRLMGKDIITAIRFIS